MYDQNIIILVSLALIAVKSVGTHPINAEKHDTYNAAVVEFQSKYDRSRTPLQNMMEAVGEFTKLIDEASSKNADIIVFPEYAITTSYLKQSSMYDILPFTSEIPVRSSTNDVHPNPCNDLEVEDKVSSVIHKLSCTAKEKKIYIVVNLPERQLVNDTSNNWEVYNTNLVFDKEGGIITKYRKYNLFMEPAFNITKEPEIVSFTTDFGVTFGIMTCFDMLFSMPAIKLLHNKNVTDIICPSAWNSQLPFLTATQTQAGWAKANGVNLLAAGYSDPINENGGSGIYTPCDIDIFIPTQATTTIIMTAVPKLKVKLKSCNKFGQQIKTSRKKRSHPSTPGLMIKVQNLTDYTSRLVDQFVNSVPLCHGEFCCKFTIHIHPVDKKDYTYRMMVYQGNSVINNRTVFIEVCGVVACLNQSLSSCGSINYNALHKPVFPMIDNISVSGKFSLNFQSVVFPSAVNYNLEALAYDTYDYAASNELTSIELKVRQVDLLTFGIFGNVVQSSTTMHFPATKLVILVLLLRAFNN